jgi:hypothetical protein
MENFDNARLGITYSLFSPIRLAELSGTFSSFHSAAIRYSWGIHTRAKTLASYPEGQDPTIVS